MDSGSHGSGGVSRSRRDRSELRESTPGPDLLIVFSGDDVNEYTREQRLRAANNSPIQGDAVSHPFPRDFSLNQGNSASDNGDGEDMTEEEFFAQFGEEVPEWAKHPPNTQPEVQHNGDDLMELNVDDLEAQLDTELAAEEDDLMEIPEEDLLAQLNAEMKAESRQKARQEQADEAARYTTNVQEAMQIAAEKAVLSVPPDQNAELTFPTEEELEAELNFPTEEELEAELNAELNAGDAAGGTNGKFDFSGTMTVMSTLDSKINPFTVNSYPKKQCKNRAKKKGKTIAPKPTPKPRRPPPGTTKAPAPLGARAGRSQAPPMRRTDELPKMYHHGEINWNLLRRHVTLSTRVDLNHCYRSLGLDIGRGKAVYENLKAYLRIPGNSVDLSAKDVSNEDAKRIIARIAHKLLVDQQWGQLYFNQPSLASGCKYIPFDGNSTEVFLEFTSLVYKAMKLEEKRKKGKAKQQEEKDARAAVQHPTSQTLATTTYSSPRAVAPALPPQPLANPPSSLPRAATQQPRPQQARSQPPTNAPSNLSRAAMQQSRSQQPSNSPSNPPRAAMQQPRPQQPPTNSPNNNPVRGVAPPAPPRSQAYINGAIIAPRSVAPQRPPNGHMNPMMEAIMRMQGKGK